MNRSYLVKVSAGETDSSRVWNPRKPMIVGHPLRWVIEQADEGVRVRSLDGVAEHFVRNSEIDKTAAINLVSDSKEKDSGLRLELRPVNTIDPAFARESESANALRVFFCKADWVVDSNELFKSYVARAEGKKVFTLSGNSTGFYSSSDSIVLKARIDGVRYGKKELKKGETLSIAFGDVSGQSVVFGDSEWRIAAFNRDPSLSVFPVAATADAEMAIIRKTLKAAMIATVAMGVLAWILPASKQEQKDEPVRILLTKKTPKKSGLMTAAPKGDPKAADLSVGKSGSAKNAGRKGNNVADTKNKKVSPAGVKAPKAVAQAAPKKSAPAKAAPKAAAPKASVKASTKVAKTSARSAAPVAKKASSKSAASARPAPRSELAQALSSASLRKTAAGLLSGGMAGGSARGGDAAAEARALGASSGGSGRGALGGAGGVSTRSASVSGFGGGGSGNGDGGPGSAGAGYGRGSYSKVSGQGKSFVSLDTGASDVDEGLTRDQVGRVIHAHWNEIRYCHESAQIRSPGVGGRLTAKFSIGATGQVQVANVGSSTIGDRALHDCILSRLKGWKFPKPKGGVTVGVAYPFMFKSVTR